MKQNYDHEYYLKHKDRRKYLSYRGTTRTFLKRYATPEDIDEIKVYLAMK